MKGRDVSERAVEFILTCKIAELKNLTEEKIAQSTGADSFYLSQKF